MFTSIQPGSVHSMEEIERSPDAIIWRTVVGALENNVYIVQCATTGSAVLIDAAAEPDTLSSVVDDFGPSLILTTHGHADHVGAVGDLRSADLLFALHPADGMMVAQSVDVDLAPGIIKVGALDLQVIHTPGHTPGSVCFYVDGVLFTGDTLFPGGPGATRFAYSDFDVIIESIETRLFTLPIETPFYPGHGASSSLATEISALDEWKQRRW